MVAAQRTGVTLENVTDRFGCSHRTAQRMMGALESCFPDVSSTIGDDGRKRWLVDGRHLRDLMTLSPGELVALDMAIAHLDQNGHSADARALRQLKDKVLSLVPRRNMARLETDHDALLEAQGFSARPGPRPNVDEKITATVVEAILSCHVLDVSYQAHKDAEPKLRQIAPYGILSGPRRYLVGRPFEDKSGPVRTYRLDAVRSARVTGQSFMRPEDFDLKTYASRAFGLYQNEAEYGEVIWRFSPEAASQARGYLFHPNQTFHDENDGSLIVRFQASGHLEMCWHLYSWGDKVEVLAPAALQEMVNGYRRDDFAAMP